ncbi:AIG2-like protein D [Tanacetum coccineum]|uniref:Putative gamma-glutamylcyclotransferase n=1 Tax=Tanacetum coccineum TaxID=301880 RepID=A0ABQ4XDQ1_9ASTR
MSSSTVNPVTVSSVNNNNNVFVYGSLLADDVVRVLLHRHRFSVKGRVYPAILPVENKKITGRVLLGITAPELDILDKFEDYEYEKKLVNVSLLDTSENLQAYTYVWVNSEDPDLYGEWDFEPSSYVFIRIYDMVLPRSKPHLGFDKRSNVDILVGVERVKNERIHEYDHGICGRTRTNRI